jgi:cytochrome c oxidase subunit II
MAESKTSSTGTIVAVITLLMGLGVAYGFSKDLLPEVVTEHGHGIDRTINYLLKTTGAVYLIAHIALAVFILKYSKDVPRSGAAVPHKTEVKFALVPVLIMMVISEVGVLVVGLPVFSQIYGEAPENAFQVEVVGKQFEWLVRYPGPDGVFGETDPELIHESQNPLGLVKKDEAARDDIVKRGIVNVPVDRATVVHLRSIDVIHSFTVPLFRTKQDSMPGFTARTVFVPEMTGEFELACAELCGLGHYRMQGKIVVRTEEELEKWLSEQEPWL